MNTSLRKKNWDEQITFTNETWDGFDLTQTDFTNVVLRDMVFKNCLFSKSKFIPHRLLGGSFVECRFEAVDLRDLSIGASSGLYRKCSFKKCDFRGQNFAAQRFEECLFENCKLKRISFNDATFSRCKFIGVLLDVTFNGIYRRHPSKYKTLDNVDFSEAAFGEYVSFHSCDLTTCIPPKGATFAELLYNIYSDDPTVLSTGSADRIVMTREPRK